MIPYSMTKQGDPGVVGTLAGLAANATGEVQFDLGVDWQLFTVAQLWILPSAPSSGLNAIQIFGGDTLGARTWRIGNSNSTGPNTSYFNITSAGGPQTYLFRPIGRYITVAALNADAVNAVGASANCMIVAYPGA